ncbi:hypothetical protein [Ornithinimicrobium cerasi]|uniref:Uncharacterized protein n=1 Tax=Ornithinimicrobium cerasi TaxID=2248773 RepID=A0A285VIX8_9MICO|nr:hypothetical protein [Ornithinimicrobium cerasi]SOC52501.1 hypothetical protein SAMN05421879_101617 [Ornithinimicrobium cerasi]
MDLTARRTARWISRAAWTMAAVGTVGGQLHAVARSLSHPGDWEEGGLNRAWQEPLSRALRPLFDWSDPWTVYVTYGKLWGPVCVAITLAACLVYQRRRPTGLERRLWQVVLGAHVVMTVSVVGDYYTPQLMGVMFLLGLAAMLVIGIGGMVLGGLLLRRGFRPRTAAALLVAFLPGFFLITEVTSMGSALLPLAWGWAIAAHRAAQPASSGMTSSSKSSMPDVSYAASAK